MIGYVKETRNLDGMKIIDYIETVLVKIKLMVMKI